MRESEKSGSLALYGQNGFDFGAKNYYSDLTLAPAACDATLNNFKDMGIQPVYYDWIVTGDLGVIGQRILIDIFRRCGCNIEKQHFDCVTEIYQNEEQDTNAGGSGCGFCAVCADSERKIQEADG